MVWWMNWKGSGSCITCDVPIEIRVPPIRCGGRNARRFNDNDPETAWICFSPTSAEISEIKTNKHQEYTTFTVRITQGNIIWLLWTSGLKSSIYELPDRKIDSEFFVRNADCIMYTHISYIIQLQIANILSLKCIEAVSETFKKKFWYNPDPKIGDHFWSGSLISIWIYQILYLTFEEIPSPECQNGKDVKHVRLNHIRRIWKEILEVRNFIAQHAWTIKKSEKPFSTLVSTDIPWQFDGSSTQAHLIVIINNILQHLEAMEKKWDDYEPMYHDQFNLLRKALSEIWN